MVARARAPGKLVLAGEYAVLEGAPALVLAVDRYVTARALAPGVAAPEPPREVASALALAVREGLLRAAPALSFDTSALYGEGGRKLGLGSSAAACVAGLLCALLAEGVPVDWDELARIARQGHREAQGGGSGVDVLASAYGGLLRIQLHSSPARDPRVAKKVLPAALPWAVLWTGESARTSELLAKVHGLRARDPGDYTACMNAIEEATEALGEALAAKDFARATEAVRAHAAHLDRLGRGSEANIVTEGVRRLGVEIEPFGAAVKPSGAGGGDVAWLVAQDARALGRALRAAEDRGFSRVPLGVSEEGAHALPTED
ncbi:MAG: hypothetical protein HY909_05510 [Deltaproteobacteria bacterium]|nr:hypothetical protein [Deltaproteobacteria bacterium]